MKQEHVQYHKGGRLYSRLAFKMLVLLGEADHKAAVIK
jgi:hypothetical protein